MPKIRRRNVPILVAGMALAGCEPADLDTELLALDQAAASSAPTVEFVLAAPPVPNSVGTNEVIIGTALGDIIQGTDADDTLNGGDGGDLLIGGDGNDSLIGGDGGDLLIGDSVSPDASDPPEIDYSATTVIVRSGESIGVTVAVSDDTGIFVGPNVTCDNGGEYSNDQFHAPVISTPITVTCIAEVADLDGNISTASLIANITREDVNILFIIADDLGQDSSAQYDLVSDSPITPNLDALAASGLVFENLWVNPVCSPTRATLLSGKYGARTNVLSPGDAINPAETLIHEQLANVAATSQYQSALIGKWHLAGGDTGPNDAGIDYFSGILGGGVQDYYDWTLTQNGVNSTVTTYATTEITNQAVSWVEQQTDPWFMWVAYNAPHTPFHLPPANLHTRTLSGDQADIDANPREYYLASIEAMDAEIGRLLDSLSPAVRANTVVIFIGDNGTPNRVNDDTVFPNGAKGNLYEGGVRVPMIVSGAGVSRIGEREAALINGVDFFPTIAELAGQDIPSIHDGESFLDILSAQSDPPRDYILSESATGTAVRGPRYKFIRNDDGTLELYDLDQDSTESINLAGVGSLASEQAELEAAMSALLANGDWIVNAAAERSAYLMDNGEFVEVNVQSVSETAQLVTVTTNAIPNYRVTVTDEVLAVYESKAASDFANGSGILSIGDQIEWGQDIGYTSSCPGTGADGWAPEAAAACSTTQNGLSLSFPAVPAPTANECETGLGPVGMWLNGVPIYNWSDANSFNGEDVWNNYAVPFRQSNMDVCYGHAGNGQYHHHSYNACLRQMVGDQGTGHSPVYGYAGDGYPIHGPYHADGELTESCWAVRDYSAASSTGCGADGVRSCTFVDEEDISQGLQNVTLGPNTSDQLTFPGGDAALAEAGIYYEDHFYSASCTAQGDKYLDEHSGHDHDGLGYHYHTSVNADLEPAFPAVHGPDYFGDVSEGSFRCFGRTF